MNTSKFLRITRRFSSRLHSSTYPSSENPDEIAHFSRLSRHWWDEDGEFALLHRMNPVRMQFIRDKLLEAARDDSGDPDEIGQRSTLKGKQVLDVGCGGGLLSETFARLGAHTLGIDASASNIKIAKHHASFDPSFSSNILEYRHSTAEALVGTRQFDVVCAMEVLEHVDHPRSFLESCAELVKPGGHLFLSTISRTPIAYVLTILIAERALGLVSPNTHTFSKYVNPWELVEFFKSYRSPSVSAPDGRGRLWISPTSNAKGLCMRTEAEVRGMVWLPWSSKWWLVPRHYSSSSGQGGFGEMCNYMLVVRRPNEE